MLEPPRPCPPPQVFPSTSPQALQLCIKDELGGPEGGREGLAPVGEAGRCVLWFSPTQSHPPWGAGPSPDPWGFGNLFQFTDP